MLEAHTTEVGARMHHNLTDTLADKVIRKVMRRYERGATELRLAFNLLVMGEEGLLAMQVRGSRAGNRGDGLGRGRKACALGQPHC